MRLNNCVHELVASVSLCICRGKFGTVCKCREKSTSRVLAAKTINIKRPQDRKEVENEIEIMGNLQHPRLLQLYDAFDDGSTMVLIMELYKNNSHILY